MTSQGLIPRKTRCGFGTKCRYWRTYLQKLALPARWCPFYWTLLLAPRTCHHGPSPLIGGLKIKRKYWCVWATFRKCYRWKFSAGLTLFLSVANGFLFSQRRAVRLGSNLRLDLRHRSRWPLTFVKTLQCKLPLTLSSKRYPTATSIELTSACCGISAKTMVRWRIFQHPSGDSRTKWEPCNTTWHDARAVNQNFISKTGIDFIKSRPWRKEGGFYLRNVGIIFTPSELRAKK